MKNKKLKKFVRPSILGVMFTLLLSSLLFMNTTSDEEYLSDSINYSYVNRSIIKNNIPTIKEDEEKVIIKPYLSDKVEISKTFYDVTKTDEEKKNSLIYYNDTYMQNSGILYKSDESFDIVSIYEGTVIDVKKDEILGNIVQVKHSNSLISTYSGLSMVNVKKDQLLKQGDILGKSGKLELGETLENSFLFEIVQDGKYVNPENYFDKKLSEI